MAVPLDGPGQIPQPPPAALRNTYTNGPSAYRAEHQDRQPRSFSCGLGLWGQRRPEARNRLLQQPIVPIREKYAMRRASHLVRAWALVQSGSVL